MVILFLGTLAADAPASIAIYPGENSAVEHTHSHKLFSHSKHGKTCLNKWLHRNKGIKISHQHNNATVPLLQSHMMLWKCHRLNFPADYRRSGESFYYAYPGALKQEADGSRCDVIRNPLVYSQTISQPCIPHCAAIIKSLIRQGVDVEWDGNRNSPLAQFLHLSALLTTSRGEAVGHKNVPRSDVFLWKTGPPREIYSCESNDMSGIKASDNLLMVPGKTLKMITLCV